MLLWAIANVYPREIPTEPPGALTHPLALADLASKSTGPNSSQSCCPFLTVAFPRLLLILFFCWLPGTLPFLVFFQSRGRSYAQALCVGFAPKQTKESSDCLSPTPTPTETNAPLPSCHTILIGALGTLSKGIEKGTGGDRFRRKNRNHPNCHIAETSQNTGNNPEDLRRLAITQTPVEDPQLTLVWKTRNNNDNNNLPFRLSTNWK